MSKVVLPHALFSRPIRLFKEEKMPTAVIADDEYLQRQELRRMLEKAWPELVIVEECEDGSDALDAIVRHQPDIAFLDIRMPGLSGLDVARATDGKTNIVFVT